MNQFTQKLRQVDIFGQPINLNLDLKSKYKTLIGGLFSLFTILLLLGYTVNEIVGYTVARNVQITQESKFMYDPDELLLDNTNFIFAIRIEQTNYYQNPYFDILMSIIEKDTRTNVPLSKCTLQQFQLVLGEQIKDSFDTYDMDSWLCPTEQFQFILEGNEFCNAFYNKSLATNYKSVVLEVMECKSESSWGSQCLDRKSSNQQSFKIQLFTKNTFLNPFNNEFVAENYLDTELNMFFSPGSQQKVDYSFKKHTTYDYQGQIKIQGLLDEATQTIMNSNTFKSSYQGNNDEIFVQIRFQRGNFSTSYRREYQTITDLLSKIGGLSSSVVSIIGVLVRYYNKAQCIYLLKLIQPVYVDLSNRLYDFDYSLDNAQGTRDTKYFDNQYQSIRQVNSERKTRKKQLGQDEITLKVQPVEQQVIEKQKADNEDSLDKDPQYKERVEKMLEEQKQVMKTYKYFSKKHFILTTFQNLIQNKAQIYLQIKYFIYKFLCGRKANKNDKHLFLLQKAMYNVKQELDVFSILCRVHQLEKLKQILFDNDQLTLFNYSPKPVITLADDQDNNHFLVYSKSRMESKKSVIEIANLIKQQMKDSYLNKQNLNIENIYNSYKNVSQQNKKSTRFYYKINNKLKNYLGDSIKAIFKVSKLLKFESDYYIEDNQVEVGSVPAESYAKVPISTQRISKK